MPSGLRRRVVRRRVRARVDPATAASLTGHAIAILLEHHRELEAEDRRLAAASAMLGVLGELSRDR